MQFKKELRIAEQERIQADKHAREIEEAYEKVLEFFFSYPTKEFSLNDVVKEAGISKTTANEVVTRLIEEGFLSQQIIGRTWRLKSERGHPYTLSRKIPWTLRQIYASELIDVVNRHVPGARNVILFGSYRTGEDTEESDIDIACEVIGDHDMQIHTIGTFSRIGHRTNVPVNLHIFSRNHVDLNVFNSIANGIILWGFLEVRP